jgi:hypothetical protein
MILFGLVVFVLVLSLFFLLLFSSNAGLRRFNLFGCFDDPRIECFKLIASQPFADIDKQAGIKNRLGGKTRQPAKVLQVNVFLYQ